MLKTRFSYVITGVAVVLIVISSCNFEAQDHGKNLYTQYCESCHGADGKGLGRLIPPLQNADYLKESLDRLPCIIRYGVEGSIEVNGETYEGQMAGFPKLSDIDVANLSNYITKTYLDLEEGYALNDVQGALEKCK